MHSFACSFKEQCALYWPNNDEGLVQVGAYVMRVETEVEKETGLILREVTLTNLKVRATSACCKRQQAYAVALGNSRI